MCDALAFHPWGWLLPYLSSACAMRSANCSRRSDSESRKEGPPMTLYMEMFFVRSPSTQDSYLLGTCPKGYRSSGVLSIS